MEASQTPFFYPSVIITGVASFMELSVEPFFAVVQQRMLYEKRAAVEMAAAFTKSLVISSAYIYAGQINCDVGVLPFALGYLIYSIALICGYSLAMFKEAHEDHFSFLLTRVKSR
jgi:oligosaccharide translocation protein RFT1